MLRMLDAPAQCMRCRILVEDLLVHVEHFTVGAVANRVDRNLETVTGRDARDFLERRHRRDILARDARRVIIGLQEPCAVRAPSETSSPTPRTVK